VGNKEVGPGELQGAHNIMKSFPSRTDAQIFCKPALLQITDTPPPRSETIKPIKTVRYMLDRSTMSQSNATIRNVTDLCGSRTCCHRVDQSSWTFVAAPPNEGPARSQRGFGDELGSGVEYAMITHLCESRKYDSVARVNTWAPLVSYTASP
jgi:hypothetical protein